MRIIRNYTPILALALAVIYIYAPLRLEDLARPRWLANVSDTINRSLTARRASVSPIDPTAAANLNEDLDYRIAQRNHSADGWRSFLAAHPDGPHAHSARAELDKLAPPETPTPPAVAQASNREPLAANAVSEAAVTAPPSAPPEVARPAADELCRSDASRLEGLLQNPTGDEAMRLLNELHCETLRPEVFRLSEHLADQTPAASAAVTEGRDKPHGREASRSRQPTRHARRRAPLPPILMALFGEPGPGFRPTRARNGGGAR